MATTAQDLLNLYYKTFPSQPKPEQKAVTPKLVPSGPVPGEIDPLTQGVARIPVSPTPETPGMKPRVSPRMPFPEIKPTTGPITTKPEPKKQAITPKKDNESFLNSFGALTQTPKFSPSLPKIETDPKRDTPEAVPDQRYVPISPDEIVVRPETPLDLPDEISSPDPVAGIEEVPLIPDSLTEDMIAKTTEEVGDVQQPGVTTVTEGAFRKAFSAGNPTGNKVVIDPNINVAQVIASDGSVVAEYNVGTGDITGTRYGGRKWFTPTGLGRIIDAQKRPVGPGQEGPYKLRLSLSFYKHKNPFLLHGQYEPNKIIRDAENAFINEGYVSHGCVRFFNEDMNALVKLIGKGSAIEILPYADTGFSGKHNPNTGKDYQVYGQTEIPLASGPYADSFGANIQ